ncbi:hypothetical protein HaLaN_24745, partial [Haematococcus lacustris]
MAFSGLIWNESDGYCWVVTTKPGPSYTRRRSGARQKALRGIIWNELDGYMLVTNGPPPALNSPPPGQLTGEANTTEAFSGWQCRSPCLEDERRLTIARALQRLLASLHEVC